MIVVPPHPLVQLLLLTLLLLSRPPLLLFLGQVSFEYAELTVEAERVEESEDLEEGATQAQSSQNQKAGTDPRLEKMAAALERTFKKA